MDKLQFFIPCILSLMLLSCVKKDNCTAVRKYYNEQSDEHRELANPDPADSLIMTEIKFTQKFVVDSLGLNMECIQYNHGFFIEGVHYIELYDKREVIERPTIRGDSVLYRLNKILNVCFDYDHNYLYTMNSGSSIPTDIK